MTRRWRSLAVGLGIGITAATPLQAEAIPASDEASQAGGIEISASTDSDKTSVIKVLGRGLWAFDGSTKFQGIDIERAWFSPEGQHARTQTRVYVDLADGIGSDWKWNARVGSNGETVLGSAALRSIDWSKEFFVEREVVETPRGVDEGIYYTFAGASTNIIEDEQNTVNTMAGLQKFSGRNVRLHFRTRLSHVVSPALGFSVQLRTRYFHSTVPGEFDYYSPRDFVQLIPVAQVRRFTHAGWMVLVAAGYGAQKATGTNWQSARLGEFRLESPRMSRRIQAFVELQYSNSSLVGAAGDYHYVLGHAGLTTRF